MCFKHAYMYVSKIIIKAFFVCTIFVEPIPNNLAANMKIISIDTISITVSWQVGTYECIYVTIHKKYYVDYVANVLYHNCM